MNLFNQGINPQYAMRDQIIEKLQSEDKEPNIPVVPKHYGGVYGSIS